MSPGTTAPWPRAVGIVQNKRKSQTKNIFEGMQSADKMQLLCSKNTLRLVGFCQGPPCLPAHTPSVLLQAQSQSALLIEKQPLCAWDPGSAVTGGLEPARAKLEPPSTHSDKWLFSLRCPWQALCLSLQIPLLFSSLLSAAPLYRSPLPRGFRLLGAPAGDLIQQRPRVRNRSTSDE